jgi:YbbR domain-containing protein
MSLLRKGLLDNWLLKVMALLISFLLWAGYTAEPFVEVGYNAPLEFFNIPPQLEIAGDLPAQLHVRIRGRAVVLRRVTPSDLAISVDLSGAHEGAMLVRISPNQIQLPPAAELVRVSPAEIQIQLVPRPARPTP